jgi:hypothetical protein
MYRAPLAFAVGLSLLSAPAAAQGRSTSSLVDRHTTLLSSTNARINKSTRELIRDDATLRQRWRELGGPTTVSKINFQRTVVILVALGTRSTTGYEVQVRELRLSGNELHVFVDLIVPGAECVVGAEVQSPAIIVTASMRMSATAPPKLVFHDRTFATDCSAVAAP